jgi:hypothetical protein
LIALPVVLTRVSLIFPEPDEAALLMPATNALLHANAVPDTPLVALYVKAVPLQIAAGVKVLLRAGTGLTTTWTLVTALLQPLAVTV